MKSALQAIASLKGAPAWPVHPKALDICRSEMARILAANSCSHPQGSSDAANADLRAFLLTVTAACKSSRQWALALTLAAHVNPSVVPSERQQPTLFDQQLVAALWGGLPSSLYLPNATSGSGAVVPYVLAHCGTDTPTLLSHALNEWSTDRSFHRFMLGVFHHECRGDSSCSLAAQQVVNLLAVLTGSKWSRLSFGILRASLANLGDTVRAVERRELSAGHAPKCVTANQELQAAVCSVDDLLVNSAAQGSRISASYQTIKKGVARVVKAYIDFLVESVSDEEQLSAALVDAMLLPAPATRRALEALSKQGTLLKRTIEAHLMRDSLSIVAFRVVAANANVLDFDGADPPRSEVTRSFLQTLFLSRALHGARDGDNLELHQRRWSVLRDIRSRCVDMGLLSSVAGNDIAAAIRRRLTRVTGAHHGEGDAEHPQRRRPHKHVVADVQAHWERHLPRNLLLQIPGVAFTCISAAVAQQQNSPATRSDAWVGGLHAWATVACSGTSRPLIWYKTLLARCAFRSGCPWGMALSVVNDATVAYAQRDGGDRDPTSPSWRLPSLAIASIQRHVGDGNAGADCSALTDAALATLSIYETHIGPSKAQHTDKLVVAHALLVVALLSEFPHADQRQKRFRLIYITGLELLRHQDRASPPIFALQSAVLAAAMRNRAASINEECRRPLEIDVTQLSMEKLLVHCMAASLGRLFAPAEAVTSTLIRESSPSGFHAEFLAALLAAVEHQIALLCSIGADEACQEDALEELAMTVVDGARSFMDVGDVALPTWLTDISKEYDVLAEFRAKKKVAPATVLAAFKPTLDGYIALAASLGQAGITPR